MASAYAVEAGRGLRDLSFALFAAPQCISVPSRDSQFFQRLFCI